MDKFKSDPTEMTAEELYEIFKPEALSKEAWSEILSIADQLVKDGEKNPCKAAVLAYFEYIQEKTSGFQAYH